MISKRDISKIAKKILKRQKGVRDHQIIHPQREWTLGLLGGLILLIAGGAWSVVTYQEVTERDVENTQTEEIKQTIYRDDIVNTALRDLEERHQRYLNMIEEYQVDEPVYFEEEIEDSEEVEIVEEEVEPPDEELDIEEPPEPVTPEDTPEEMEENNI